MMLADCYRVPRLVAAPDVIGNENLVEGAPSYRCWCFLVFTSFAGLVIHSTHKYGFQWTAYNYVTEFGECFGCLKTFHTKRRLLDHLTRTKNPVCLDRIISIYARCMTPETVRIMDTDLCVHNLSKRASEGRGSLAHLCQIGAAFGCWLLQLCYGPLWPRFHCCSNSRVACCP